MSNGPTTGVTANRCAACGQYFRNPRVWYCIDDVGPMPICEPCILAGVRVGPAGDAGTVSVSRGGVRRARPDETI